MASVAPSPGSQIERGAHDGVERQYLVDRSQQGVHARAGSGGNRDRAHFAGEDRRAGIAFPCAAPSPPSRRRWSVSASASPAAGGPPCSAPGSAESPRRRSRPAPSARARSAPAAAGDETSTTCSTSAASVTSSSVARKAFTSVVGRLRMKPTVSLTSTRRREGSVSGRTVGSSVANMRASASTLAPGEAVEQRGFAGVGVAHQREGGQRHGAAAAAVQGAAGAHAFQIVLDLLDAAGDAAAVGFQLAFRRGRGCRFRRPAATSPRRGRSGAAAGSSTARVPPAGGLRGCGRARRRCPGSAACGR